MVVHAEANVALIAGRAAYKETIYVYGAPICSHCAGILIQAGIARVVGRPPCHGTEAKILSPTPKIDWDELGVVALGMFAEAHVQFEASE